MAQLILQSQTETPANHFTGDTAYLRIYASTSFYSYEGVQVTGGQVGSQYWYQQYTCPIADGLVTIPEVTLQTTTDSNVPNATYTAVFYDQAGRQQNTKLSNFFVDPQYLQSDVISNIIVSGAGSTEINGTYTYRGQHNTRNYWNLHGQDDSTTAYAIVWDGSTWLMTNYAGDTFYEIATSSQYPWDAAWTLPASIPRGVYVPAPAVAQSSVIVAATWAELTISNQGFVPNFWTRTTWDVQQIKQYINLLQQNGVPYSSQIVAGITYLTKDPDLSTVPRAVGSNDYASQTNKAITALTRDPDIAASPEAVGSNDYTWLSINQTVYLDGTEYQGDVAAAIAGIGSEMTELRITSDTPITDDTEFPVNIFISRSGNGQFTIDADKTLTINAMLPIGNRQMFFGEGRAILGPNAVAGSEILASWWVGIENTDDDLTFQIQQVVDSASNNDNPLYSRGAIVRFGTGTWHFSDITWPNLVTIAGAGNSIDGGAYSSPDVGTTLKLYDLDADCVFRLPEGYYGQRMHGVNVSIGDSTTASCILGEGDLVSGLSSSFVNVTFQGTLGVVDGEPGDGPALVKFHYTNVNNAEFVGNKFTQCWFQVPEASIGFYCDTINTEFTFDTCQFQCAKKATARRIVRCGWWLENNPDNRGVNTYNFTRTFERTIASATITQNGSSYSSTMVLDGATPSNKQFKESDIGEPITSGSFFVYVQRLLDPFTAILSYHPSSTITAQPVTMQRWDDFEDTAYAAYDLDIGAVNQFQVIGGADEGFNYSLTTSNSSLLCNVNFQSYTAQGRIAFNGASKATFRSCALGSCALEDNTTAEDIAVTLEDCEWTIYTPFQAYLLTATAWRRYDSSTRRILESGIQPTYTSNTGEGTYLYPYVNRHGNAMKIIDPYYDIEQGTPFLGIGSSAGGGHINALRIGRVTATVPVGEWLYYYDLYRDNADGLLKWTGNQGGGYTGYSFDTFLNVPTANIPDINSSGTITSTGAIRSTVKGLTKGVGYGAGAGDQVTQVTSRTTSVTINAMCGLITTSTVGSIPSVTTAPSAPWIQFTVNNNCVAQFDNVIATIQGDVSLCQPFVVGCGAGYFIIRLVNQGNVADTLIQYVKFTVIKSVVS